MTARGGALAPRTAWRGAAARHGTAARRDSATQVVLTVALCSGISALLEPFFHPANLVPVFLAGVVFVAARRGRGAAVATVLGSLFVYDLVFVPPRWSLKPTEPQYWIAFAVMLGVGLLISRLVALSREQAEVAEARARRANALSELSVALTRARSVAEVVARLREALASSLAADSAVVLDAGFDAAAAALPAALDVDAALLRRALELRAEVGAGTAEAGSAALRYIPLVADAQALGVLVMKPAAARAAAEDGEDEDLARALANQAAIALDRARFESRSVAAAIETERERLRSTLLAGISHDFRTPLTTIVGNATTLLEQGDRCDAAQQLTLLRDLLEQAERLHVLTSNLLELTRLEEGAVQPVFEWCPADEIVVEALDAMRHRLQSHAVQACCDAEALVWCDPRLVVQALTNLLDNAARHTPAGGRIEVAVGVAGEDWRLVVHAAGPGVPAGQEAAVFRKFHRAGGDREAGGKGLGLAICAAVAHLHGGTIGVTRDGGARFEMVLPQPPRAGADGAAQPPVWPGEAAS